MVSTEIPDALHESLEQKYTFVCAKGNLLHAKQVQW